MVGISKNTIQFLKELKQNNYREWFKEHQTDYKNAKDDFSDFIGEIIKEISRFDDSISDLNPKDCIFRIFRDVRFSKDKSPYKTNMGAHILSGGKKAEHGRAGYYVHLEPGNVFLAGGAYLPPGPWLKAIRKEIAKNPTTFLDIIHDPQFKSTFGAIEGDKLKTAPKGYPKDHPYIEWLRHKSYLAVHKVSMKNIYRSTFSTYCGNIFQILKPFDDFLNRGLKS